MSIEIGPNDRPISKLNFGTTTPTTVLRVRRAIGAETRASVSF